MRREAIGKLDQAQRMTLRRRSEVLRERLAHNEGTRNPSRRRGTSDAGVELIVDPIRADGHETNV